jgi:cellulose synthase operon protein C
MLKVECEGCGSPYKVDDRRVPPGGLKMRCPKCGATFVVRKEAAEGAGEKPAAPALHTAAAKRTMLGVGAPGLPGLNPFAGPAASHAEAPAPPPAEEPGLPAVAADLPAVSAGLPAAKPGAPPRAKPPAPKPPPPKPPPPAPPTPGGLGDELDLPSFGGAGAAAVPVPPPLDFGDISADIMPPPAGLDDLPAVAPAVGLPAVAPARKPPPPPPKPPARPAPPQPVLDFGELSDIGGIDLPSPADGAGLPAPVAGGTARGAHGVMDLPATAAPRGGLPAPKGTGVTAPMGKIDLPGMRPSRQITGAALGFGEPDLPIIAGTEPGLPAPKSLEFGSSFGELDLPLASDVGKDLPSPMDGSMHLPAPSFQGSHLPAVPDPSSHLPIATAADRHLPAPASSGPMSLDAEEFDVMAAASQDEDVWPKAPKLGAEPRKSTMPMGSQPPPASPASMEDPGLLGDSEAVNPAISRQAGGGTSFGEVNLGDGGPGADLGGAPTPGFGERALGGGEDDMEFGGIPQEKEAHDKGGSGVPGLDAAPAPAPKPRAASMAGASVELPAKRSKAVKITGVALLAIIGLGAGLAATPYGAFGMNVISDAVHSREHGRLIGQSVTESRRLLGTDTAEAAGRALALFDDAVGRAPRQAPLASYGAFLGFLREVRFGPDPAVHAHATALLAQASKIAKDADYIGLAKAAEAVAQGQLAKARSDVQALARKDANDIDVAILAGELELVAGDYKTALQAWETASKIEDSPRTAFGRARAHYGLTEIEKCKKDTQSALDRSPEHVGARILMARVLRRANADEKAMAMLDQIAKPGKLKQTAGRNEMVAVYTLLGDIHLARSRMSSAEGSFAEALKLDPKDADALCGFGEVLYREGRFAEALARFEAAIQANAESVPARIGAAKTKIALERLQDAKEILKKLREARPADPQVAFWLARAEEALGNKSGAERILADAVARALPGDHVIELYVALARFLAAAGKNTEAEAKLAEAKQKLPDSLEIRKAFGDIHLQAGRLEQAKAEFDLVLERDPQDLYALFNSGVCLLRMKKYDEAQSVFDKVSAVDKNYPGLALERGVLFEASGQEKRALEMYQEALSGAPNDPDLQLRVGSAEIANGHAAQAEEILRKVLTARPNSAEANHYLGRALLLKGTNLAESLRHLQRAAEIDPNKAEYWLYVGWAANDAGQPNVAGEALHKALDLDKSLADAYWQRGILERRQSAVRDAERDLLKALELKPSRYEAYATLAECYEEGRRWDQALGSWRKAISGDPDRSLWHYKLARLLWTNHNLNEAGEEAAKALQLAAKEARPNWLWEAHMIAGDAQKAAGKKSEAIASYKEFMKLAPPDSPYRHDVRKALQALGGAED